MLKVEIQNEMTQRSIPADAFEVIFPHGAEGLDKREVLRRLDQAKEAHETKLSIRLSPGAIR